MPTIRLATEADATAIAAIYRPIVLKTATSFEAIPPDATEFEQRRKAVQERHLWLVCEEGEHICGYAYAGVHRSRLAYQWSTETSVYVHEAFRKRGVARALYAALLDGLRLQGYKLALAGITLPNVASEAFHKTMGFTEFARFKQVGYKFGEWHSTLWLEKELAARTNEVPIPPIPFSAIDQTAWKVAVEQAYRYLH